MNQIIKIIKNKISEATQDKGQRQTLENIFLNDNAILNAIESFEARINELELESEALRKNENILSEQSKRNFEENNKLNNDIIRLDGDLINHIEENNKLKVKIERLEDENRELKNQKNDANGGTTKARKPEKDSVSKKLKEAEEKIEILETGKESLLEVIRGLKDQKKNLKIEKSRLERDLESYVNPDAEATLKKIVSENAARVALEKELEIVREEFRKFSEEKELEIDDCDVTIRDLENRLEEVVRENVRLEDELELHKNSSPNKKASPQPSRVPSRLSSDLPS